jgi:hypothetical protein
MRKEYLPFVRMNFGLKYEASEGARDNEEMAIGTQLRSAIESCLHHCSAQVRKRPIAPR